MFKYVNNMIKKRANKDTKIINLYSNSKLVAFYNSITNESTFFNDIEFYEKRINKDQKIVELASGSGRILKQLIENGYDTIGIELEKMMIESMEDKYKSFVVNNNILNVKELNAIYKETDIFILPATTISLFSIEEIIKFLVDLKKINKNFKLIFDLLSLDKIINKKPKKVVNELGTFYYINFISGGQVVYNLFDKDTNIVGVSRKQNHSLNDILVQLKELEFNVYYTKISEDYYMIEGSYNE
ncbi:TPA: hypothetical protein OV127_002625 [Staphylococcus aureus]|uniref:hypothetical protein n=1 Tax=Staphylococcus aureus TaxID=1280 RepID=UPI0012EE5636|nr:hypothetical protein [Staphylococcus aureus]MBS3339136.1 hypothetical protein [Staphylococcus aureus]MBS3341697.1 hypothetical protein [Staphylococcus aureus]MCQ1172413.1 hypothetical protein [Staphylococcus aureus]MCQ1290043.1 hypothetical protein [Staphylococcus aureus]MCQ1522615.1 hypothetical protein [Staphylococcus aureus]